MYCRGIFYSLTTVEISVLLSLVKLEYLEILVVYLLFHGPRCTVFVLLTDVLVISTFAPVSCHSETWEPHLLTYNHGNTFVPMLLHVTVVTIFNLKKSIKGVFLVDFFM